VVRAFSDWFSGYGQDPKDYLRRTFEEVGGYDEIVILKGIPFESHCEHHMAPIIGEVHVGYLPGRRVVGISKLARPRRRLLPAACRSRSGLPLRSPDTLQKCWSRAASRSSSKRRTNA
jgi:hypothetical protein